MDKFDELQEFDLEDILKEFQDEPQQDSQASAPEPNLLSQLSFPEEEAPSQEGNLDLLFSEEAPAPESASSPAAFDRSVIHLEDTNPMEPLFSADDLFAEPSAADSPDAFGESEAPAASMEDTQLFTPAAFESEAGDVPLDDAVLLDETLRLDTEQSPEPEAPTESAAEPEAPPIPPPIQFTPPRSRLRELKKKLVAGPEKRYYILSEAGIGKLQAAILVNVIVVLLCGGITTLFVLGMVPENRLRLVIFSQVLAMLISALMGCQLMLDSILNLFKGRFTIEALLTISFGVCLADSVFCLKQLRVPCCAAFCLSMTMALWARYERHTTEMAQMDTMRKAVRLTGIVKQDAFFEGKAGLLRREGEVEDFMETYNQPGGPEKLQRFYAFLSLLLCTGIAVFAGLQHGVSMGIQILSTSLLVAVPASFFVAISRPAAVLEQRLHMVGTVLCGWKGVKTLCCKAVFPLKDQDLFPQGCTKLNGVKFYGSRNPDEVVSYCTSLIYQTGGGLVPVFQQLLDSREGAVLPVENFRNYGEGGVGGEVGGEPVLLGDMAFLQDMGVEIPEGTMVNQAVYAAIDGQLCAVYAISYAKMRSSTAGLLTLSSYRRLSPIMVGSDFMLTEEFIQAKFNVKTRNIAFPDPQVRRDLSAIQPDPQAEVLAMTTRDELVSAAYAVTGARALSTATKLGVAIHLIGGILGMLIMLILAILGNTELLSPTNVLLYQLIWAVPGLLVTEWARAV